MEEIIVNKEKLYTAEEIASILQVSTQWIYNLSSSQLSITNRLPYISVGRLKRYKIKDVLSFFEDRTNK